MPLSESAGRYGARREPDCNPAADGMQEGSKNSWSEVGRQGLEP